MFAQGPVDLSSAQVIFNLLMLSSFHGKLLANKMTGFKNC